MASSSTNLAPFLNTFVGDSGTGGQQGLVPAPPAGSAAAGDFLAANGTWAVPSGTGGGVTSVGALDGGIASAKGLSISGNTIFAQTASATFPGLVTTGDQIWGGIKKHTSQIWITTASNFLQLGAINPTTYTSAVTTASRTFTTPDADSNSLQPLGSATANNWVQWVGADGIQHLAQPSFSNLSGLLNLATQVTGILPIANGGTNLSSLGTANQLLGVNAGASALEYKSLSVGTSGTDFAIAYSAGAVAFNLPDAGASARGAVTTGSQSFAGAKTFINQVNMSTLTASQAVVTDSSKNLVSLAYAITSTASALIQRDSNQNAFANSFTNKVTSVTSAAGTTTLTAASTRWQNLTGTTTQTFQLPDATTLTIGTRFDFNNNSTGLLTVKDGSAATLFTIPAGGQGFVLLLTNSVTAGSWDYRFTIPSNVQWGTASLNVPTLISSAQFQLNGSSSGTISILPQAAAGTYNFNLPTTPGTSGQVLTSAGGGSSAMTWTTLTASGVISAQGTVNQVLVNGTSGSAQTGACVFATPQDIATTSNVQFARIGINTANSSGAILQVNGTSVFGGTTAAAFTALTITGANNYAIQTNLSGTNLAFYGIYTNNSLTVNSSGSFGFHGLYAGDTLAMSATAQIVTGVNVNHTINASAGGALTTYAGVRVQLPTITGNPTITAAYGGYFSNPAHGTTKIGCYADDFSAGYPSNNPPTNGAIILGKVGIANTNPQSQFDVTGSISAGSYGGANAAPSNGMILSGSFGCGTANPNSTAQVTIATLNSTLSTGILVNGANSFSGTQQGIWANITHRGTAGGNTAQSIISQPVFSPASATTITTAACFYASPFYTSSAGTVTTSYGYYYDGGGSSVGTITTAYGAYFKTPAAGSTVIPLYADSASFGYQLAAPTNGIIVSGQSLFKASANFYGASVEIQGADRTALAVGGTRTANAGSFQAAIAISSTFSPTTNTSPCAGFYAYMNVFPPTSVVIANAAGLWLDGGAQGGAGSVTNGWGIYVNNPSYGTNKYAAYLGGKVGINTVTPLSQLDVSGNISAGTYAGANAAPTNGMAISGVVLIGTSTDDGVHKLQVSGSLKSTTATFSTSASTGYVWTASNTSGDGAWQPVGAGGSTTIKMTRTAVDYALLTTDDCLAVTATAAPFRSIALPYINGVPYPAPPDGKYYIVKDESGTAATHNIIVTVSSPGGGLIENSATTYTISTNFGWVEFVLDFTNSIWLIIGKG